MYDFSGTYSFIREGVQVSFRSKDAGDKKSKNKNTRIALEKQN